MDDHNTLPKITLASVIQRGISIIAVAVHSKVWVSQKTVRQMLFLLNNFCVLGERDFSLPLVCIILIFTWHQFLPKPTM